MNIQNWKIFNKVGSYFNWDADPMISLNFIGGNGLNGEGYAITDPSGIISNAEIIDGGFGYDIGSVQTVVNYPFSTNPVVTLVGPDASVTLVDVSVFNPYPSNSGSIQSVTFDYSTNYIYPSVTYAGAVFLEKVSVGLVENELLTFLEETSTGALIRPYDNIDSSLIFRFYGGENQIQFFTLDETEQLVTWSDELTVDTSIVSTIPLYINIGFRAESEGVYERVFQILHVVGDEEFVLGEVVVNAQAIGQDERYDALTANFGLYNAKDYPQLFKETNINEALPDWEILNYKQKHLILQYDQIMPYIGTYKALINSLKWLGYDDIYVNEWFKNVKDNTKLSLRVPFDAPDRTKTLLLFSPEERKNLKKLNELSLVYCLTRETGEVDENGVPITENCYSYSLNEVYIKLYALKKWLENNIIGVNARINDLTGEGIYYERFGNIIYATENYGDDVNYEISLSPVAFDKNSELKYGDSSIGLTLSELSTTSFNDLHYTYADLINYGWDPSFGALYSGDPSVLDPSYGGVLTGPSFLYCIPNLTDIQWKGSVIKYDSGVLTNYFVTKPLFVYNNEILFYNPFDTSTQFYDVSTNLDVIIEAGTLRDASIDIWEDSLAWRIYIDPSNAANFIDPSLSTGYYNNYYIVESSNGLLKYKTNGYPDFRPNTNGALIYEFDANYMVPLLSFQNYKFTDASGTTHSDSKKYFLDITDGKIAMNQLSLVKNPSEYIYDTSLAFNTREWYINFNYDTSLAEQMITLNVVYMSDRMPLYLYDPCIYYWYGADASTVLVEDNSIYYLDVNHTGDYNIEIFGWDGQNNIYNNNIRNTYNVWTKYPTIFSFIDSSNSGCRICSSTFLSYSDVSILIDMNPAPIFDRQVPLQGLTLEYDTNGQPYLKVPSISYFVNLPTKDSYSRFYNLTERCTTVAATYVIVDPDYQQFYNGDNVNLVLFDKGSYNFIDEASTTITAVSGNQYDVSVKTSWLNREASTQVYIQNDTLRNCYSIYNNADNLVMDICTCTFRVNQLVGVIVTDNSTSYSWGSSYRVVSRDGSIHTFDNPIPDFLIDPSVAGKYSIQAKYAFSAYADFQMDVSGANETSDASGNIFSIFYDDIYKHIYYLDNTFLVTNIDFDQNYAIQQWFDASTDMFVLDSSFYYGFKTPINIDISSLVILNSYYDPSDYMLNQRNIWTLSIMNGNEDVTIFKVHNSIVPFIFDVAGVYNVQCESYDSFGNLKTRLYEGLITVK